MEAMLKTREVAKLLGVGPETVRQYAKRGKLPGVRLGGKRGPWRWALSTVLRFAGLKEGYEPRDATIEAGDRAALIRMGLLKPEDPPKQPAGKRDGKRGRRAR